MPHLHAEAIPTQRYRRMRGKIPECDKNLLLCCPTHIKSPNGGGGGGGLGGAWLQQQAEIGLALNINILKMSRRHGSIT